MGIGLCLTDSHVISESERVNKMEPTADLRCVRLEVERHTGTLGGNTRRRFHGTVRACTLGDTSRDRDLCVQTSCNMCRIIEVRT